MERILCLAVGYLFGLFQTGYIYSKLHHVDIRKEGSGNAGSTNVLRVMGVKAGATVFLGDFFKTLIPCILVRHFFQNQPEMVNLLVLYTAFGVILGHNYPFYLGFKGGKGIAVTAAVVMSACHPLMIPIGLAIFIIMVALTRYVSVGSLFVAWYIPANTLVLYRDNPYFVHMMVVSLIFTALAYFQHRNNIVRLIHGNENPLWGKKKNEQ